MFHTRLQRAYRHTLLREHRHVEVVVVVRDYDLPGRIDPDADRIVGDTHAAHGAEERSVVVEDDDAMTSVVTDEYLLSVIDRDTVREVDVFVDDETVEHRADDAEDNDTHNLGRKSQ